MEVKKTKHNLLIVGAGQLGSRYLQGLSKCEIPLSIYVCDVSAESLAVAQSRWFEVGGDKTIHQLQFANDFSVLPDEIDLAIISTNALVRPLVVEQLAEKVKVKNWLLEKVLAQSEQKLALLKSVIGTNINAWVNTPYRAMEWYNKIKSAMNLKGAFFSEIKGGNTFGLACNVIHYLDLLVWFSGEIITGIHTHELDKEWFKSKRPGFWDIFGSVEVFFSKGSKAIIRSDRSEKLPILIHLKTNDEEWMIHESDGIAIRNNNLTIKGRDEYQSEMTARIVESILVSGNCQLPRLAESVSIHIPMIRSLLDHWNRNMPEKLTEVPIT